MKETDEWNMVQELMKEIDSLDLSDAAEQFIRDLHRNLDPRSSAENEMTETQIKWLYKLYDDAMNGESEDWE